jgi:hypothetical protein
VSSWIDQRLRLTACNAGEFAGPAIARRLNRREYHNTIRDLLGIDFDVIGILPADGTGGAGFDTNGETLFVPPVLLEKYMEAAQQVLDRVIITPQISRTFTPAEIPPTTQGEIASLSLPMYTESSYEFQAAYEGGDTPPKLLLKWMGLKPGPWRFNEDGSWRVSLFPARRLLDCRSISGGARIAFLFRPRRRLRA